MKEVLYVVKGMWKITLILTTAIFSRMLLCLLLCMF